MQRRAKGCLGHPIADPDAGVAAAIDPTRHTDEFREAAERGVAFEFEPPERNGVVGVGDVALEDVFTPGHTSEVARATSSATRRF